MKKNRTLIRVVDDAKHYSGLGILKELVGTLIENERNDKTVLLNTRNEYGDMVYVTDYNYIEIEQQKMDFIRIQKSTFIEETDGVSIIYIVPEGETKKEYYTDLELKRSNELKTFIHTGNINGTSYTLIPFMIGDTVHTKVKIDFYDNSSTTFEETVEYLFARILEENRLIFERMAIVWWNIYYMLYDNTTVKIEHIRRYLALDIKNVRHSDEYDFLNKLVASIDYLYRKWTMEEIDLSLENDDKFFYILPRVKNEYYGEFFIVRNTSINETLELARIEVINQRIIDYKKTGEYNTIILDSDLIKAGTDIQYILLQGGEKYSILRDDEKTFPFSAPVPFDYIKKVNSHYYKDMIAEDFIIEREYTGLYIKDTEEPAYVEPVEVSGEYLEVHDIPVKIGIGNRVFLKTNANNIKLEIPE